MKNYKNILLTTDFGEESSPINERAVQLAKEQGAKLNLIHVAEYLYSYSYMAAVVSEAEIQKQLLEETKTQLAKLGEKLNVPPEQQYACVGTPKHEIIEKAKEIGTDLIVVGSHGRHGISLLLGSTSNAILHHAPCDVLCVRLKA